MGNVIGIASILSVFLGLGWGLANFWCMARLVRCAVAVGKKRRWAGWVALKLFGLYATAAWLLVGLKVPAIGWLIGFTLSLAGAVICMRAAGGIGRVPGSRQQPRDVHFASVGLNGAAKPRGDAGCRAAR